MLENKNTLKMNVLIVLCIIILVLLGTVYFKPLPLNKNGDIESLKYKAVFLTNGQVYFGKMNKIGEKFTLLKDIYYLELRQPLQDQKENEKKQNPNLALIKLGNELHSPKDEMMINNGHILFIEELKDSSEVYKTINKYKNEEKK